MALRAYRSFLRVAANLPATQRAAAVAQARTDISFHRDAADPAEIERLVADFDSRVAFLRMTTPRRRPNRGGGKTRVLYRDGERLEVGEGTTPSKAAYTNWDGANMDPDSVCARRVD